jgi:putative membrane protein
MMKAVLSLTISLLALSSISVCVYALDPLKESDKKFITTAAGDGLAEVKIGHLAETKAGSSAVKAFAIDMVRDHSKANDELKTIAKKKGVELPKKLDPEHAELYAKLSKASGAEFDKTYMDKMVHGHKEVIDLLTDETHSSDATLKDWAAKTLPTIQEHLEHAQKIDAELNKK